ncbi:MAG: hypothetical protein B7X02_03235 [Rhodospirillales bacterium 12-54-5]|nr:MAG: hypothetical protein B7X02_03235 [Rhodospirillales bacterium 12-54-5]
MENRIQPPLVVLENNPKDKMESIRSRAYLMGDKKSTGIKKVQPAKNWICKQSALRAGHNARLTHSV